MALTNISKEPRREITETILGLLVVTLVLFPDYFAAVRFQEASGGFKNGCPWPIGMIFIPLVILGLGALSFGSVLLIHFIGEKVCGFLRKFNIDPRPVRR
jgi:hypothetical protein